MFITRFIISNLFSAVLIGIILLLKRALQNRVSLKFQYHIWFVLLFSLAVMFLPSSIFHFFEFGLEKQNVSVSNNNVSEISVAAPDMVSDDWLYDFTEMTETVNKIKVDTTLLVVWIIGAFLILVFYYQGNRKLRLIKRFADTPSEHIIDIFELCRKSILIKRKIYLLQSDMVTSPISFGCRTPYIILPCRTVKDFSDKEIEHIILHELTHIKNRDIWINLLSCIEQLIYWFNPIIWWAFSKMKRDREAYCDWTVLNIYSTNEERLCYGDTLLQFAREKRNVFAYTVNGLFENKTELKHRIEKIADYKKETIFSKILGNSFTIILAFTVILQAPVFAAFAYDFGLVYTPQQSVKITSQDYSNFFGDTYGCAVVYNLQADVYNVYNETEITKRIAPCSTFKIYSAINALEQGIITPDNNTVKWDYLSRAFPAWNSDQTLNSAMSNSVNWYFQFLDNIAGADQLNEFYKNIGYGNEYVGNDTEYYWNGTGLKISPLEQVELLVDLYNNEFGFCEANINAVKNSIFLSEANGNKLYGKTGTGRIKGNDVNGWFIGFVETYDNIYFFAFNIQDDANATGNAAAQIAYSVFKTMGINLD